MPTRVLHDDASGRPAPPPAEPTVRLTPARPTPRPDPVEPTVQPGPPQPTVDPGVGESTVHLGVGEQTVRLGGAQPTAGPGGARPTVGAADTGRTTAAGTGTVYGAHTAGGGGHRTAAAPRGAEVRFGPGVPATPPAAPAWPTPPARRRPFWRTVTSVLSALLTVALLVAVGVYLWQRISPLEISGVNVTVPEPAGDRCDVTVEVVATVRTNGRGGVIEYQWLRSGSPPSSVLTERVGRGQRSVDLTLEWTFSGVGSTRQTATVNITSPAPVQAQTEVAYDCRG